MLQELVLLVLKVLCFTLLLVPSFVEIMIAMTVLVVVITITMLREFTLEELVATCITCIFKPCRICCDLGGIWKAFGLIQDLRRDIGRL